MMWRTHLLFALVSGLIVLQFYESPNPYLFLTVFCFFGLVPDIDHSDSKFGKKLGPISTFIQIILGHRGILHSIFPIFLIVGVGWYFGILWLGLAAGGGYLTHLISDSLTVSGVKFLGPLGLDVRGIFHTGGILEAGLIVILLIILTWRLYILF
ncbi:MAG: metal-dependent hydrolase [Nanoarchaeota archaeon]|nr:metal-dependent hydrolase [Nanoarchaeota archaeon]